MGTKAEELVDGCFARAAADEPLFVLRARDPLAPQIVRKWADRFRTAHLNHNTQGRALAKAILKYEDAMDTASKMEAWNSKKLPD